MYLSKLHLDNFRSYTGSIYNFTPQVNLILGPNGSGKTNILEAVYLLSTSKSFRSSSLSKLISWQQSYATVQSSVISPESNNLVEIQLVKKEQENRTTVSRKFLINHVPKTRKKYLGYIQSIIFHPEDIRLVTGSPSRRRDFLNEAFLQNNWLYLSSLSQFNRALKHRNELLDLIRLGKSSPAELFYWDQSLAKNDQIIHQYRLDLIAHLNHFFQNHSHSEIRLFRLNYRPSFLTPDVLKKSYLSDLKFGYTHFGCHHDDFSFDSSIFPSPDKNLAFWGSRGQQRLAVLALRLAQIDFYQHSFSSSPVLLLDDIFSELDPDHRTLVSQICQKYQTIFTSSEENSLSYLPNANLIRL